MRKVEQEETHGAMKKEKKIFFFSCLPIDKITFTLYNVSTKKEIGREKSHEG